MIRSKRTPKHNMLWNVGVTKQEIGLVWADSSEELKGK